MSAEALAGALVAVAVFGRLRPNVALRYHGCGAESGLIEYLAVLRSSGMRDLLEINGPWTEECHDLYKCCAFADCCCDLAADTVRLHSHQIVG
jgi:hypothetical protein